MKLEPEIYDLFRLHDNSLLIITWSFMIIGSISLVLDNVWGLVYFLLGIIFATLEYLRKDRIIKGMMRRFRMEEQQWQKKTRVSNMTRQQK